MVRHSLLAVLLCEAVFAQGGVNVVRPVEIQDVLVNPGMGIQTFQRFNGEALYPTLQWSEAGPTAEASQAAQRPDFPGSSLAYCRWFWSELEPRPGQYRWEIIDSALEQARKHDQKLDIRMMPYDQGHPLPEWYRNSGARRANQPSDKDGEIWSPDAADPLYLKHWGALVLAAGVRYDGHPWLDSVDVSTVGYWGEGWGPYLPSWQRQKELIDLHFEAFKHTPLLINFDEPRALEYGVKRGAGWRLDCWGDLGGRGKGMMHMLDMYPQQVVRTGIQEAWQRYPVSLETCGTPGHWKKWNGGYSDAQLDDIFQQALRWHATSINIKSTSIPRDWRPKWDEFQKRIGYRLVLRRFEYPKSVKAGRIMHVTSWWVNQGVAPPYGDFILALRIGDAVVKTAVELKKWLPGDQVFDGGLWVPDSLPPGSHKLHIAVLDARTEKPAVRLAIQGLQPDGWYELGAIQIQ
ncbi:MAG: DUF4832 domain-containing protein [Acidobacteria bacterium]|nr:DUF4832 domain-containing protein [Acidobacteriota bacterium]